MDMNDDGASCGLFDTSCANKNRLWIGILLMVLPSVIMSLFFAFGWGLYSVFLTPILGTVSAILGLLGLILVILFFVGKKK